MPRRRPSPRRGAVPPSTPAPAPRNVVVVPPSTPAPAPRNVVVVPPAPRLTPPPRARGRRGRPTFARRGGTDRPTAPAIPSEPLIDETGLPVAPPAPAVAPPAQVPLDIETAYYPPASPRTWSRAGEEEEDEFVTELEEEDEFVTELEEEAVEEVKRMGFFEQMLMWMFKRKIGMGYATNEWDGLGLIDEDLAKETKGRL